MNLFDLITKHWPKRVIPQVELTEEIRQTVIRARELMNDQGAHWIQNSWAEADYGDASYEARAALDKLTDAIEFSPAPMVFQDEIPLTGFCLMGGYERAAWETLGKPDMSLVKNQRAQQRLVQDCAVWLSHFIPVDGISHFELELAKVPKGVRTARDKVVSLCIDFNDSYVEEWTEIDSVLQQAATPEVSK